MKKYILLLTVLTTSSMATIPTYEVSLTPNYKSQETGLKIISTVGLAQANIDFIKSNFKQDISKQAQFALLELQSAKHKCNLFAGDCTGIFFATTNRLAYYYFPGDVLDLGEYLSNVLYSFSLIDNFIKQGKIIYNQAVVVNGETMSVSKCITFEIINGELVITNPDVSIKLNI